MRNSERIQVGALIIFVLGIVLIVASSYIVPSNAYSTFGIIPYTFNPAYASAFAKMLVLFFSGVFISGLGLGMLGVTYYVSRLERRLKKQ